MPVTITGATVTPFLWLVGNSTNTTTSHLWTPTTTTNFVTTDFIRMQHYSLEQIRRETEADVAMVATLRRGGAERRAEELLMEVLNETQRAAYRQSRAFELTGASGRRYRLRKGWTANIDVLHEQEDRVLHRLCCHVPAHEVPNEDNLITQLFMLSDAQSEHEFLTRANRHPA